MLDQIEESIDLSTKQKSMKQNKSPAQNVSLLKIRKNSKSFGDAATEKPIIIYWYDEVNNQTHEFQQGFNEILTIGDVNKWAQLKVFDLSQKRIDQALLYLPKKKFGKPNEDYPYFRNELQLKDCNQAKFAIKIHFLEQKSVTPPKSEKRSSYNNSLNSTDKKIQISEKKQQKPKSQFYCFCYNW